MTVLIGDHDAFLGHDAGEGHPELPRRLVAVRRGVSQAGVRESTTVFRPRTASREELTNVHESTYVTHVEEMSKRGGGRLDSDTAVSSGSFEAACRAAGSGLDAIERLRKGEGTAAFLATRPPGHHASRSKGGGFCLFNSAAIACAQLLADGERVVIIDLDAHHGNGTQEIFYKESAALYISVHQSPFYPGTGGIDDVGSDEGLGATINVPVPAGTAGDLYRYVFDELVVPAVEEFAPSWLVVSAGFDAHRDDPLTDLGLSAGDYSDLTTRSMRLVSPGRRLFFLEGGYDEAALAMCAGATVAALCGERFLPERPTSGGLYGLASRLGERIVQSARERHDSATAASVSSAHDRYGAMP